MKRLWALDPPPFILGDPAPPWEEGPEIFTPLAEEDLIHTPPLDEEAVDVGPPPPIWEIPDPPPCRRHLRFAPP